MSPLDIKHLDVALGKTTKEKYLNFQTCGMWERALKVSVVDPAKNCT